MPRRLLLALLILVAAPLVLLGWVSATATANSKKQAEEQLVTLLRSRLVEIDRSAAKLFDGYATHLTSELSRSPNVIAKLQVLRRKDPIVRQGVFVSNDGQILYPPKPAPEDADAVALYAALPGMISGRAELAAGDAANQRGQQLQSSSPSIVNQILKAKVSAAKGGLRSANSPIGGKAQPQSKQPVPQSRLPQTRGVKGGRSVPESQQNGLNVADPSEHQWQIWYMDQGMQLIYWMPRPDGTAVGILLERPRWASDLTASLPDTTPSDDSSIPGFTTLVDESRQVVYRWGDEGKAQQRPAAFVPTSAPLSSWQWEFHSTAPLVPQVSILPMLASLAGIGVVLLALGGYVLTSVQRQMRAARNRVSFAGQVSHELRTPLTNIRLYAELAESDLEELPPSESRNSIERRLGVIDSESKRLGRLVSGVLEMIRHDKTQRGPRLASANPNLLINETLGQFAPTLDKSEFVVQTELETDRTVQMDADIFEMVLVNLLSNVEKYAVEGKFVGVSSRFDDDDLVVTVTDKGPGVRSSDQRKIFRPFARLDDSINAPSGTGIGLTIARNAATRHGGRLELIPSERGACFEFRIPVTMSNQKALSAPSTS